MVTNNNITLSPSLIYKFSLHVGVTPPLSITAAIATRTLLTLHYYHHNHLSVLAILQHDNKIITILFLIYADKIVLIDNWKS